LRTEVLCLAPIVIYCCERSHSFNCKCLVSESDLFVSTAVLAPCLHRQCVYVGLHHWLSCLNERHCSKTSRQERNVQSEAKRHCVRTPKGRKFHKHLLSACVTDILGITSTVYYSFHQSKKKKKEKGSYMTYEGEEDEESGDVSDHSTERDLQRTEHLEGRHQVGRPGDTQHVGNGEQDVRHDLRVIRLPLKPR